MMFLRYWRDHVWDALFCAVATAALVFTAYSAFYATQPLQGAPWLVGIAAVLLTAALFSAAYNTRTLIVGSAVLVVATVAAVAVAAGASPAEALFDDVEGNYVFAIVVAVLLAVLVFALSRRRATAVVLFVFGVFLCAAIEYLYWYGHLASCILFVLAAIGLVVLKGYERSVLDSDSDRLAFGAVSAGAVVLTAAAVALAAGVFFAFIAPLNPPSQTVKLFTEYRNVEEVEIMGTGTASTGEEGDSGDEADDPEKESEEEAEEDQQETASSGLFALLGIDEDAFGNLGTTTRLVETVLTALIFLILAAALVAGVVFGRRALRRRRFARMTSGGNDEVVRTLYGFFLSRFRKLKIEHPDHLTPTEYAREFATTLESFESAAPAPTGFAGLTDAFVRSVYGGQPATDEDVAAFKDYYDVFYANARSWTGTLRYVPKFFTM